MSKKLVQINVVCNGSTGRIMTQIQKEAEKQGWEAYSFYGRGNPSGDKCFKIGNKLDTLLHVVLTRVFNKHGHGSKRATKKLVKQIEQINPDVIQLHNVHGYYINLKVLFNYLKKCNKKIVWTLHDCWAFTGHCTHFTSPKCIKWETQCENCIRKKDYPKSMFKDTSKKEYKLKKELFTDIKNLTIVTPSDWLADLVKKSFLKDYKIKVVNNGVDLNIFKPTKTIDVLKKYNIPNDKRIILGVSSIWNESKGLADFLSLAKIINNNTIIVLIGIKEKQKKSLPTNIIPILKTENIEELANWYTIADVLFNPSKEETFSLVTVEAIACGTPVIAYNNSAVIELIDKENGICLPDNVSEQEIIKYIESFKNVNVSKIEKYSLERMNNKYIEIYKEV